MYKLQDHIIFSLYDRCIADGFKHPIDIQSCSFSKSIEESKSFRIKLLKASGIPLLIGVPDDFVEITVEVWFDGNDIICTDYIMFDRNLMEGNKGPIVECMGSVVWIDDNKTKLLSQSVYKLIPFLKKIKYVGPLSINAVVTKDKVYAIGVNASFLYNSIFVLLEMYKGKVGSFLDQIANNMIKPMEFKSKVGIGVDLSILPFPISNVEYNNISIDGLNKYNLKHFWGYDIQNNKGKYQTVGRGGRIGTFTARGDNVDGFSPIRDARRRVYRTINNVKIHGVMYRSDIGNRVESDKLKLANWGWL